MSKRPEPKKRRVARDWLPAEVDFSGAKRGATAARYAEGTNLLVLAPDIAAAFPSAQAVNEALRAVVVASRLVKEPRRRTRRH